MVDSNNIVTLNLRRAGKFFNHNVFAYESKTRNKSLWAVLFRDGRVYDELNSDWLYLPQQGRIAVRLYCPNGQVAEFGSHDNHDCSGKIFQLKQAFATVGGDNTVLTHIIGMIDDINGNCTCIRWDYETNKLYKFKSNVESFSYNHQRLGIMPIGKLAYEHLGIRS